MLLLELIALSCLLSSLDCFHCGFCIAGLNYCDGFTGGRVLGWEAFVEQVGKLNEGRNENER
jgi:hypothetical protein